MRQTSGSDNTLIERVEQALNTMRPYLAADGGNVNILDISPDRVVRLELVGSCGTCPMSAMTFKGGLEDAILRAVPEVTRVEAVNLSMVA